MNFKKFYINGNKFTFTIRFCGENYWNTLMLKLTNLTTKKIKLKEHDIVALKTNLPNLKSGTVGTIIFIYSDNKKYEVEFYREKSTFIETVSREQLTLMK